MTTGSTELHVVSARIDNLLRSYPREHLHLFERLHDGIGYLLMDRLRKRLGHCEHLSKSLLEKQKRV